MTTASPVPPLVYGLVKTSNIGKGTFGRVYEAKSYGGENLHAVKRLLPIFGSDFIDAIRELDLMVLGQNHPFIIRLTEIRFENPFNSMLSPAKLEHREDTLWPIMIRAKGDVYHLYRHPQIRTLIRPFLKGLFAQLLLALEFLHNHEILHRDIKPENVMLDWEDPTPERPNAIQETMTLQLGDLGMAKPLERGGKATLNVMTPFYKAPEVAMECPYYGPGIDIWSAGVFFFFMLCNKELLAGLDTDKNADILAYINMVLPLANERYPGTGYYNFPPVLNRTTIKQRLENMHRWHPEEWPPQFDVNQTADFLTKMLVLRIDRPSAQELLNDPWFDDMRPMITAVRGQVPTGYIPMPFATRLIPERDTICNVFIHLFNNKQAWGGYYNYRILFLAMDLADRCLAIDGIPSQPMFPMEYQNEAEAQIRAHLLAHTCLYIAMKYFITAPSITGVIPPEYRFPVWMEYLRQSEIHVLRNLLYFSVFRPNLYEVADRRDDDAVLAMLRLICKKPQTAVGMTPIQMWHLVETELQPLMQMNYRVGVPVVRT